MLNFSEFLQNSFILYISEHFLSVFQKLFQNFPNFIKFLRSSYMVFLQPFQNFFRINSNLSCNFSKAPTGKSEILLKFWKIFNNVYKFNSTRLKNFLKIFIKLCPNFLGKHL